MHQLEILRKITNSIDNELVQIFPLDTPEHRRLFKLLRKAYVDARYKPSHKITHKELLALAKRVETLKEIGKLLCRRKISSFTAGAEA